MAKPYERDTVVIGGRVKRTLAEQVEAWAAEQKMSVSEVVAACLAEGIARRQFWDRLPAAEPYGVPANRFHCGD